MWLTPRSHWLWTGSNGIPRDARDMLYCTVQYSTVGTDDAKLLYRTVLIQYGVQQYCIVLVVPTVPVQYSYLPAPPGLLARPPAESSISATRFPPSKSGPSPCFHPLSNWRSTLLLRTSVDPARFPGTWRTRTNWRSIVPGLVGVFGGVVATCQEPRPNAFHCDTHEAHVHGPEKVARRVSPQISAVTPFPSHPCFTITGSMLAEYGRPALSSHKSTRP
jgi:hypothetical protein